MGIFVLVFSSIVLLLFMGAELSLKTNTLKTSNNITKFLTDNSVQADTSNEKGWGIQNAQRALIRTCQEGQSWVLICQHCFATGQSYCPYPTASFCQSARNVNTSNMSTFWAFLPNAHGTFSDIKNGSKTPTSDLTSMSQFPSALRYEFSTIYNFSKNKNYNYTRPSGIATDVCGVSGVASN